MKQPFEKVVEQNGSVVLRVCRLILAAQDAEDASPDDAVTLPRLRDRLGIAAEAERCCGWRQRHERLTA